MSRLMTSAAFTQSLRRSKDMAVDDIFLYDEGQLLKLNNEQQCRELYVRNQLDGSRDRNAAMERSKSPKPQPGADPKIRVALLKRQIKETRAEKQRILSEGVIKVQSYMEQLKREHEAHAREMQKLRQEDIEISTKFIAEVERLKSQFHSKKPLDQIIAKVKATIAASDVAEGQSISSIHVTEVDPNSLSD